MAANKGSAFANLNERDTAAREANVRNKAKHDAKLAAAEKELEDAQNAA